MCVITASGSISDPVFFTDANMNDGVIDVHEVNELGSTAHLESKGYIVFCSTRQGMNHSLSASI